MPAEINDPIQQVYLFATESIAAGKRKSAVIRELIEIGIPEDAARHITEQAYQLKKSVFRKQGLKTICIGAGLIALGAAITGATYSMASSGGYYIATTGLFLVGGFTIIKGLWRTVIG